MDFSWRKPIATRPRRRESLAARVGQCFHRLIGAGAQPLHSILDRVCRRCAIAVCGEFGYAIGLLGGAAGDFEQNYQGIRMELP